MAVGIYLRNATEKQVTELRTWVEEQGYNDIVVYLDVTESERISEDNELLHLIEDVKKHNISAVFVNSINQIFSDVYFSVCLDRHSVDLLILYLLDHGVQLFSKNEEWIKYLPNDLKKYLHFVVENMVDTQKQARIIADMVLNREKEL